MFDFNSGSDVISLLGAMTLSSLGATGTGVDVSLYTGIGKAVLDCEAGTGDMTCDVKLQHSADEVTDHYSDITGAVFPQVTTTAKQVAIPVDFDAVKKNVRAVAAVAGTTPEFVCACHIIGRKQVV